MTTGQIYMLLGLLSFGMLGVLHKVADVKKRTTAGDQRVAGGVARSCGVRVRAVRHGGRTGGAAGRGAGGHSVRHQCLGRHPGVPGRRKHGHIATSWLAINLSAGIPTVASILIYDEPVGMAKALALALIPVSMFLLWQDKKQQERRS